MVFTLPPLAYDDGAFEPIIDAQTMHLHHHQHHRAYVEALNAVLGDHPLAALPIEDLVQRLDEVPADIRTAVRHHAGGHANHSLFELVMAPQAGDAPIGELGLTIDQAFGSFGAFKEVFQVAGAQHFGSGWVWLVWGKDHALHVTATPNEDSPLMDGHFPLVGNDVWEHASYLSYSNRRIDYLKAWWQTLDWERVADRFSLARTFTPYLSDNSNSNQKVDP